MDCTICSCSDSFSWFISSLCFGMSHCKSEEIFQFPVAFIEGCLHSRFASLFTELSFWLLWPLLWYWVVSLQQVLYTMEQSPLWYSTLCKLQGAALLAGSTDLWIAALDSSSPMASTCLSQRTVWILIPNAGLMEDYSCMQVNLSLTHKRPASVSWIALVGHDLRYRAHSHADCR